MYVNEKGSCETMFPSYRTGFDSYAVGTFSPCMLSLITTAIGGALLGFTAAPFDCSTCPATGFIAASAIGLSCSILSVIAHLCCNRALVTDEQIRQYRCNLVGSTVISIAAVILNSIALNDYIKICNGIRC